MMSIHKGDVVEMIYLDQHNQITQRKVRVIKNQPYSIIAYCYTQRGIRTFLKDGILAVQKASTAHYRSERSRNNKSTFR